MKRKFLRQDWHKRIKLGSKIKKKRKWRAAKGRHSKIRLGMAGHIKRPKIGFGGGKGGEIIKVENLNQIKRLDVKEVIIGKIGKKKKEEILKNARERGIKILNKYRKENAIK